jgi:hypothetical protein
MQWLLRLAKANAFLAYAGVLAASAIGFATIRAQRVSTENVVFLLISAAVLLRALVRLPKVKPLSTTVYRAGLVFMGAGMVMDFAWADWLVSLRPHNGFGTQLTKLDAFYFAITTLSTIGYGDIHPATELARGVVTAQIVLGFGLLGYVIAREIGALGQTR